MRIAIFGGTGSIGMATGARLASRGLEVTLLSRRRPEALPDGVTWEPVDVTNGISVRDALAEVKADRVVHLAALLQFACELDPAQALRVNVDGTLHVLQACEEMGIARVVFGSSIAVYGERTNTMREGDAMPADVSFYGLTKRVAEALGEQFHRNGHMEFVALRYSAVFGPGEATTAGMARVRDQILRCARGVDVTIEGACGDELTHLTHVDDAAEATCMALMEETLAHAVYNVAGPPENYVSLRELHGAVREVVPKAGCALWSERTRSSGPVDVSRLAHDFGWRPRISLKEGLRALLLEHPSHQVSLASD